MSEGPKKNNWKVVDLIDLAHDRGRWRALVINLMKFLNFKKLGEFIE